jgi:hypothetical protein
VISLISVAQAARHEGLRVQLDRIREMGKVPCVLCAARTDDPPILILLQEESKCAIGVICAECAKRNSPDSMFDCISNSFYNVHPQWGRA